MGHSVPDDPVCEEKAGEKEVKMLSVGVSAGEMSPVEGEKRVSGQLTQDQPVVSRVSCLITTKYYLSPGSEAPSESAIA